MRVPLISFIVTMKKTTTFFICLLFFSVIKAQGDSCAKFKTGVFSYIDDSSHTSIIRRTSHMQEEKNNVSGIITKFKVRWLSDCEYQLTQTWSNNKQKRRQNRSVTRILITKAYNNKYEFTCACNTADVEKKQGVVFKIK